MKNWSVWADPAKHIMSDKEAARHWQDGPATCEKRFSGDIHSCHE